MCDFFPPRVQNNSLTTTKLFCQSLTYDLFKDSHLPTHNSNFWQNCWGKQHNSNKDNLGHSLHYQLWLKPKPPLVVKPHTWNLPWCGVVSNMRSIELVAKTTDIEAAPNRVFWSIASQPRKTQRHGWQQMGQFFKLGQCYKWLTAKFRNAVGPCMDFSVHVPTGYLKEVFSSLLTWKQIVRFTMDPNTVYVLESTLISMDGAIQIPISEFEASRWHNSRVCVLYFQVCKFQSLLLAKYLISVNNCSCSQINFGQTAVEEKLILCCVLVSPLERR